MADGTQTDISERVHLFDIVIASGTTTSTAIPLKGWVLAAIDTPGTLTSTSLSFTECATETGTYKPIYNDAGSAYSVTVAATRHIIIDPSKIVAGGYLKVVMGSSEGGDRTLTLRLRRVD